MMQQPNNEALVPPLRGSDLRGRKVPKSLAGDDLVVREASLLDGGAVVGYCVLPRILRPASTGSKREREAGT